jgi:DNA-binding LacI/PurR family transcriptional regulator
MVLMRNVADLAGVSIAIVSHVVERDSIGWVCTLWLVERHA